MPANYSLETVMVQFEDEYTLQGFDKQLKAVDTKITQLKVYKKHKKG